MILTDTHTHLYSEAFDEDRKEMMQRAIDAGVERFFVPAIDSTYTPAMLKLKKDYPSYVHLMAGLHPTHVKENYLEELAHVHEMLDKEQFVAIGEIGVDLYWSDEFKSQQIEAFKTQIDWSIKRELPIAIHCRDAFDEVFEVLESYRGTSLNGIFHCFTGSLKQAQLAVDLNMSLGIGGVSTFKNGKIDKFLREIDLKHIVLETDAPYLAPVPYRGKRNESAYIALVAQKLAEVYDTGIEHIAEVTTLNSTKIFGV
ncbi:putative deoxyribonuclease YcfH [Nonlabens ulvanivorans]|uniref:Putative deoxyribonuclease YcfH n=1 Tax=Nonlabens ulvanivorans TaxID=906888 RepID=A0A081DCV3_NONUL|nr:TatD family hydrolase [Nonlabens ulvanivorans]GAK76749.1 putative deoxyribonuclease YcfH [Nonlabens ulvanivorans]GAL00125.1 putative deoxyribonuclease YcfH [Nonlabens ulvanivorans]